MRRLTLLPVFLFSMCLNAQAASNVKTYPASLCYQSAGPANSVLVNTTGNLSNSNIDSAITLFCPVLVEQTASLSALQVEVTLIDGGHGGDEVSCQVSGSHFGERYTSRWGNAVRSEKGAGLQAITTSLSELNKHNANYVKANLSCSLPAASQAGDVSLISYQVTELYR
ncbi:hypothetical protein [Planctobacterium marinum]|uniref:hypothetical protein n=1 Tax=Planctobacterium marinum TaxID=1631968 RepID=UPI001E41B078|nr:hypothetical protein [Planctobacterium marinum]MCC2604062.1 hypothetical protein [Planctobacterium marinum]